jgi:hypothetical protein
MILKSNSIEIEKIKGKKKINSEETIPIESIIVPPQTRLIDEWK